MNLVVVPDGKPREGWALRNAETGVIPLSTICATEGEATLLLHGASVSQAHVPFEVVPVSISLHAVSA